MNEINGGWRKIPKDCDGGRSDNIHYTGRCICGASFWCQAPSYVDRARFNDWRSLDELKEQPR